MEVKEAVGKLNKAVGRLEPREVDKLNTERATAIVNALKLVDEATAGVVAAVNQRKKGLEKELRQHKRKMERLFSSALPEKVVVAKEQYAEWGLKNWQVEYLAKWNDLKFTGIIKTKDELRKAVGAYNKAQFQTRLQQLVTSSHIRRSADGTFIVNKLDVEVLERWQLLNK